MIVNYYHIHPKVTDASIDSSLDLDCLTHSPPLNDNKSETKKGKTVLGSLKSGLNVSPDLVLLFPEFACFLF